MQIPETIFKTLEDSFYNLCPRKFIPIGSQSPMCDAKQCRLFDKKKRCNYLDTAWAWRQHWTLSASNQTGFSLEVHVYILAFCSYVRRNLMKNQKLSNGHVSLGILWKNNISIYCIGKEKEVKKIPLASMGVLAPGSAHRQ